MQLQYNQVVC